MTTEDRAETRTVLEAFDRAVGREAHNLTRWPELTWQQLYNRLQWEEGLLQVLEPALERHTAPAVIPWLRTRIPPVESKALLRTLQGHGHSVAACAASTDGSFLVSMSADGVVKIWDVNNGAELRTLNVGATGVAVTPDSSLLIAAAQGTLKLWDVESGEELRALAVTNYVSGACALSPDGALIACVCGDRTLKVWDTRTGRELSTFSGHADAVFDCAMSPDGTFVASAGRDGIRVWDPYTGQQLHALCGVAHEAFACAVSPDATFVVSGGLKVLTLFDPRSGQELGTLEGHRDLITGCAVSPDGAFIVSASLEGTVKLWDPATAGDPAPYPHLVRDASMATFWGHAGTVSCCTVSPDASFLVSGGDDQTLMIWAYPGEGAEPPERSDTPQGHFDKVKACAVSPDGSFVVSAGGPEDCTVRVWDPLTGREIRTLGPDISPELREDMRSGAVTFDNPLPAHTHSVNDCAVGPDASFVVSASGDKTLKLWDPATGTELRTLQCDAPIFACAVSPDGSLVVSACSDGTLRTWDTSTGREIHALVGHQDRVHDCAVSPDGSYILSASADCTLKIWDTATGRQLHSLEGHVKPVIACVISPDGNFIVSASTDETLMLWDPGSGKELRTIRAHRNRVTDLAVTCDGTLLVSTSIDRVLNLWDLATGTRLSTLFPASEELLCVAADPGGSLIVCGEGTAGPVRERAGRRRSIFLLDLWELGSPIVTAVRGNGGPTLRCPKCWKAHRLEEPWLGQVIDCPTPTCDLRLRVNSFLVGGRRRPGLLGRFLGRS